MLSIPSLPATPAVPAAPPQASAASSSVDDPNSFANYLKAVQGRQSDDAATDGGTSPKLAAAAKDKSGKDSTSNSSDKKKSSLLTDTVPVAVNSAAPAQDPKAFQLSWLHASGNAKNETKSSLQQSAASASQTTAKDLSDEDSSHATSDALKGKVAEAVSNAPVAFGATLSKQDVLRADGLKIGDTAKAEEAKANDAKSKTPTSQETAAKNVTEVGKASESKNSNNQQHSGASQDDQPAAGAVKAATATAHADSAGPAIHTVATEPSAQVSAGAATVQNAYAPASAASVSKTADVAPTTAVAEPAPTPTVRPQNIDLKIAGADNSQVDVRVSQRAGDVQVTVRTPDGDLAQSLRQHLPELSDRLSQAGVSGDLWQPQTAQASNSGGNDADSRYSDDAQTQQQNQQQQSRQNNQGSRQQNSDTWNNEFNQANNKESR